MKRKSRALKCLHFAKEGQDSIGSESDGKENLVTSCISEDGDHEEPDLLDKPSTLHSQATRKQMREPYQNWRKSAIDLGLLVELVLQLQQPCWKILVLSQKTTGQVSSTNTSFDEKEQLQ